MNLRKPTGLDERVPHCVQGPVSTDPFTMAQDIRVKFSILPVDPFRCLRTTCSVGQAPHHTSSSNSSRPGKEGEEGRKKATTGQGSVNKEGRCLGLHHDHRAC